MKTALSIGDTFKFKRGRKIYTISEIRHDCHYYYHDQSGIEYSVDLGLFPNYLDNTIIIKRLNPTPEQ